MLHLSTWEAIPYQIFLKKINQARLKNLFPVQRVAAIVASWAAATFFFFTFSFGLVGKYCHFLGKQNWGQK